MQDVTEALESKANKQSVANALHRKANRVDMDTALETKVENDQFAKLMDLVETKVDDNLFKDIH